MAYINTKGYKLEEKKRAKSRQMAEYVEDYVYPRFIQWCADNKIPEYKMNEGIEQLRSMADFHRRIADHESV
jgi:ribosome-associated toxin RatA of RatAB toxin-antitoxin module